MYKNNLVAVSVDDDRDGAGAVKVADILLGSTADRLVRQAYCAVHIAR